jgi:hypothetical protein
MQWYIYPLSAFAIVFLGFTLFELIGRPIRSVLDLRRRALARMLAFENMALPRPRELAISSQAIHEYDLAVRNLRQAQYTFHDLGSQLLALGESEPSFRILLAFFGFNIARAGRALIHLSQAYAMAKVDCEEVRHAIGQAAGAAGTALLVSRRCSRNAMIKFRLEPMHLREMAYRGNRGRLGRPPVVPRHAARGLRPIRQPVTRRIASTFQPSR